MFDKENYDKPMDSRGTLLSEKTVVLQQNGKPPSAQLIECVDVEVFLGPLLVLFQINLGEVLIFLDGDPHHGANVMVTMGHVAERLAI